jgi:hypothetical protein
MLFMTQWRKLTYRTREVEMAKLEDLIVDESIFDRDQLASALAGLLVVTSGGELRKLEAWNALRATGRVIAGLLGLKAAHALGMRPDEAVSPSELSMLAGIPVGTAKRELRELATSGVIDQRNDGRYSIAGIHVSRAIAEMKRGSGDGQ